MSYETLITALKDSAQSKVEYMQVGRKLLNMVEAELYNYYYIKNEHPELQKDAARAAYNSSYLVSQLVDALNSEQLKQTLIYYIRTKMNEQYISDCENADY